MTRPIHPPIDNIHLYTVIGWLGDAIESEDQQEIERLYNKLSSMVRHHFKPLVQDHTMDAHDQCWYCTLNFRNKIHLRSGE